MKSIKKHGLNLYLFMVFILFAICGCGTKNEGSNNGKNTNIEYTMENQKKTQIDTIKHQEQLQQTSDAETSQKPWDETKMVEPLENLSEDFIWGMDASSVLAEENSGVKYYNFQGEEQDVFLTLSQAGTNYIRLRVWNDPYDENGNGYGGGNNDVSTAMALGKRATKYGMKVCIDFHYSDFWADPKRQHAPKDWESMTTEEKGEALYAFTVAGLTELLDSGVDVGMVQIGNEINFGMSDETEPEKVAMLLRSGSKAVREISDKYEKDIQIVVHYTDLQNYENLDYLVSNLNTYAVDYDILGLSYYPFWHGGLEDMHYAVKTLKEKYDKKIMIVETSYCYTFKEGDGFANSIKGTDDIAEGYPATVQGQANMIRDIIDGANEAGAMGVFYWEGTWIPVGEASNDNSSIWEEFGSGWASSYASEYDPEDAGLYYGGCSWENQALFDFNGYPLASLNIYNLLRHEENKE